MEAVNCDRLFIVTGGPGSGKSTLIDALGKPGIRTMPEAGRAIIQDQLAIGGEALPWSDRRAFAELMLSWEMRSYREALKLTGPVIFDRGVPDVLGYLRVANLPISPHVSRAAEIFRYHPRVFIAPPWPEIFIQDAERKQSLDEAAAVYEVMNETYSALGYKLIPLPFVSIEERAQFLLTELARATRTFV